MKIGIFDLETSGFYADSSILLCCSIKQYEKKGVRTIRADNFKNWKDHRTNEKEMIDTVAKALDEYDILIAHNEERFDKKYFNAKCLEWNIKPILRFKKVIDPIKLSWNHMRVGRNSLAALIDYFGIPVKKTPIELKKWLKAAYEGDKECMQRIVVHCEHDVITLEAVYNRLKMLVDKIDTRGSAL